MACRRSYLSCAAGAAIIAVRDEFQLHDLIEKMHEFDLSFFSNSTSKEFLKHFLLKGTLQVRPLRNPLISLLAASRAFMKQLWTSDFCAAFTFKSWLRRWLRRGCIHPAGYGGASEEAAAAAG